MEILTFLQGVPLWVYGIAGVVSVGAIAVNKILSNPNVKEFLKAASIVRAHSEDYRFTTALIHYKQILENLNSEAELSTARVEELGRQINTLTNSNLFLVAATQDSGKFVQSLRDLRFAAQKVESLYNNKIEQAAQQADLLRTPNAESNQTRFLRKFLEAKNNGVVEKLADFRAAIAAELAVEDSEDLIDVLYNRSENDIEGIYQRAIAELKEEKPEYENGVRVRNF